MNPIFFLLPIAISFVLILTCRIKAKFWLKGVIILAFSIECVVSPIVKFFFLSNEFIFLFYPVILIAFFIKYITHNDFGSAKVINYVIAIYVIIAICNIINKGNQAIALNFSIGLILCIFFIILVFTKIIHVYEDIGFVSMPKFYFSLGIIFFTVANFPFLLYLDEIRYSPNLSGPMYDLFQFGNIFLSLGYLMTVLCHLRNNYYSKKSSTPVL